MASLNRENKMVSRRALLLAFASTLLAPRAGALGDFEQDFFGGEDPDLLPPPGLKAMCQACSIGVTEVWRRTPALRADPATLDVRARREREATAFEVTERGFCAESNFLYYAGSHMVRGRDCKAFLERFNDESQVEERLSAGVPGGHYFDLQNSVCKEVCEYPRPASARRPGGTPPHIYTPNPLTTSFFHYTRFSMFSPHQQAAQSPRRSACPRTTTRSRTAPLAGKIGRSCEDWQRPRQVASARMHNRLSVRPCRLTRAAVLQSPIGAGASAWSIDTGVGGLRGV